MAASRFATLLSCGAFALVAAVARGQEPQAIDVHVLELTRAADQFVPTARVSVSKRLVAAGSAAERAVEVRAGGWRLAAEIARNPDGSVTVTRQSGGMRNMSHGTTPEPSVDLTEPWRWGRVPRHGGQERAAMICEPVTDAAQPFAALDPRGFVQRLADIVLTAPPEPSPGSHEIRIEVRGQVRTVRHHAAVDWTSRVGLAARFLGSVPLREYLEPRQVERLLEWGKRVGRGLVDEESVLARPLIALGQEGILERLAENGVRSSSSDAETRPPRVSSLYDDALLVAFATAPDPRIRGLAGWLAMRTRSVDVYEGVLAAVREGRAVLPGEDDSERARKIAYLENAQAWQSVTSPVLTLAATAVAIAAIMVLLRVLLRRAV
jgi:hypothetical protein